MQKTRKAVAKRFKFTATGKAKFKRAGLRHNLGGKASSQKVKLRASGYVFNGELRSIERNLPYGN